MSENLKTKKDPSKGHLILALHSCSEILGIAILDERAPKESLKSSTFPIGRSLSNNIFNCLNELLPTSNLKDICRISVAIGPGGFTGTRITVVLARTLAQQLDCDLDGMSSFSLMAPRLLNELEPIQRKQPFWIIKNLPRRGIIGGKYQVKRDSENKNIKEVLELQKPHLLPSEAKVQPSLYASNDVEKDVLRMLSISLTKYKMKQKSNWHKVLPIYPTSPVENKTT